MKKFLILFIAFSSVAFGAAGDRYIENSTNNGDLIFQVNKGGVKTEAARIKGTTGSLVVKGDTTGATPLTGEVGEVISATASAAYTTANDAISITLTPGVWIASGAVVGNSVGSSNTMIQQWKIKGVTKGADSGGYYEYTPTVPSRFTVSLTPVVVVIAPADGDKTVKIRSSNTVSQSMDLYVQAIMLR